MKRSHKTKSIALLMAAAMLFGMPSLATPPAVARADTFLRMIDAGPPALTEEVVEVVEEAGPVEEVVVVDTPTEAPAVETPVVIPEEVVTVAPPSPVPTAAPEPTPAPTASREDEARIADGMHWIVAAPGQALVLSIPVELVIGGVIWYPYKNIQGEAVSPLEPVEAYDQNIRQVASELYVTLDADLFLLDGGILEAGDDFENPSYIVDINGNHGYAVFQDLAIRGEVAPGEYRLGMTAAWVDAATGRTWETRLAAWIRVEAAAAPEETWDPSDILGLPEEQASAAADEVSVDAGVVLLHGMETTSTATLAVPVTVTAGGVQYGSNVDANGSIIPYSAADGQLSGLYDQQVLMLLQSLVVELPAEQFEDPLFPLALAEGTGSAVSSLIDETGNHGYAVFSGLALKETAVAGEYPLMLNITWQGVGEAETHQETIQAVLRLEEVAPRTLGGVLENSVIRPDGIIEIAGAAYPDALYIVFTQAQLRSVITSSEFWRTTEEGTWTSVILGTSTAENTAEGGAYEGLPGAYINNGTFQVNTSLPIGSSLSSLVIDGTDPFGSVVTYQDDLTTNTTTNCLRVADGGGHSVLVRNINLRNFNYYGIVYAAGYQNVWITMDRVDYQGRQLVYADGAATHLTIRDSDIRMRPVNGTNHEEVCEIGASVTLAGTTTISTVDAERSMFYYRQSNGTLAVPAGAQVTIDTVTDVVSTALSGITIDGSLTLSSSASTRGILANGTTSMGTLTVNGQFILNQTVAGSPFRLMTLTGLVVGDGGTLEINQTGGYGAIYNDGPLSVGAQARLSINQGATSGGEGYALYCRDIVVETGGRIDIVRINSAAYAIRSFGALTVREGGTFTLTQTGGSQANQYGIWATGAGITVEAGGTLRIERSGLTSATTNANFSVYTSGAIRVDGTMEVIQSSGYRDFVVGTATGADTNTIGIGPAGSLSIRQTGGGSPSGYSLYSRSVTVEAGGLLDIYREGTSGTEYNGAVLVTDRMTVAGTATIEQASGAVSVISATTGIVVSDGGTLSVQHTGGTGYSLLTGSLSVGSGAVLEVFRSAQVGPTGGAAAVRTNRTGAAVAVNDPLRVWLYNGGGALFSFGVATSLTANTQIMNLWHEADISTAGADQSGLPTTIWHNDGGGDAAYEPFSVSASFATSGNTSSASASGLVNGGQGAAPENMLVTAENPGGRVFGPASFGLGGTVRMLTMGRAHAAAISPVPERLGSFVRGTSQGDRVWMTEYAVDGTDTLTGQIEHVGDLSVPVSGGMYTVALADTLARSNSRVYVLSRQGYLHEYVSAEPAAVLALLSAPDMPFEPAVVLPDADQLIRRSDPDWTMMVKDSRGEYDESGIWQGAQWRLTASVLGPMEPVGSSANMPLRRGLVYLRNWNAEPENLPLVGDTENTPIEVGAGTSLSELIDLPVRWAHEEGIMVYVEADEGVPGVSYQTTILWTLESVP